MSGRPCVPRLFVLQLAAIFVLFVLYGITLYTEGDQQAQRNGLVQKYTKARGKVTIELEMDLARTAAQTMERKRRIKDICREENMSMPNVRSTYIRRLTDPKYSFMYCRVNKAASTRTVSSLAGFFNCSIDCMRRAATKLQQWPVGRINNFTNHAYKFMFVREPYGRLFSTYSNKFYFPKGNWAPVGPEIVKRYRQNPSADSLKYGHDITFAELIRYVVDEIESGNEVHMDEHVRPMHLYCHSCDFEYDFIGKLETMTNDWQYLIHEFNSRHILQNRPEDLYENHAQFRHMYWVNITLQKIKESNISIYSIYERAWGYNQITGTISKHAEMPFSVSAKSGIKYLHFIKALQNASRSFTVTSSEASDQKRTAMLQAYSTIPLEYLERLRKVVMKDCLLYGYDDRPQWLFDRNTDVKYSDHFMYFKGLPQIEIN